ncbi:Zinc finger SWIM-type protein [Macrophomina phaseolina MS6]|uniref:Zinc finger SWIM-type protein n=1 Tax=Macrophomina phaseolina (strain MS6) TaxID=1126212 RepID=K2R8A6_MACPH|nr:Zinc finger SWIM-type protein [Macrophomina phaseolina MS6]
MLPTTGTLFSSVSEAQKAILIAVGNANQSYKPASNNNRKRWAASCAGAPANKCPFYARAAQWADGGVRITQAVEHTCPASTHLGSKQARSRQYLSHVFRKYVADRPFVKPDTLISNFPVHRGQRITSQQARRARRAVLDDLYGDEETGFRRLEALMHEIHYPRSVRDSIEEVEDPPDGQEDEDRFNAFCDYTEVKTDTGKCFDSCFVCPYACVRALLYCIPVIILDSTFIKSRYGMCLFVAAVKDFNNGTLPVAWGVYSAENDENWGRFCEQLARTCDFRLLSELREDQARFSIVSDRNSSLLKAVREKLPQDLVHHYFCVLHLAKNVRNDYDVACEELFKRLAWAEKKTHFAYLMEELRDYNYACADQLQALGYEHWARSYAPAEYRRYGQMTSNAVESVNSELLQVREYLPFDCLYRLYFLMMEKFAARRLRIHGPLEEPLTRYGQSLRERHLEEARELSVARSTGGEGSVFNAAFSKTYKVDLNTRSCTCRFYQENQFPCGHAFALSLRIGRIPNDVEASVMYGVDNYRKTYEWRMSPIEVDILRETEALPPRLEKRPGRPRKKQPT